MKIYECKFKCENIIDDVIYVENMLVKLKW